MQASAATVHLLSGTRIIISRKLSYQRIKTVSGNTSLPFSGKFCCREWLPAQQHTSSRHGVKLNKKNLNWKVSCFAATWSGKIWESRAASVIYLNSGNAGGPFSSHICPSNCSKVELITRQFVDLFVKTSELTAGLRHPKQNFANRLCKHLDSPLDNEL